MKRTGAIIFTLLWCFTLSWGQSTREIVTSFTQKLSEYKCLHATYTFAILDENGGSKYSVDGEFFSQGDLFLVKTDMSDIYCDGMSKSIYDKTNEEVIIIGHDKNDGNMSENPLVVLSNASSAYDLSKKPQIIEVGGERCYHITLIPKSEKADHVAVDILVAADDYTVRGICYTSKGGELYRAHIKSISGLDTKPDSFFTIDLDALGDIFVTDLR